MRNNSKGHARKRKTRRDAVKASRKNSLAFTKLISAALGKRKLGKLKKVAKAIIGKAPYVGRLLASDIGAKDELRRQLISHFDQWQKQHPKLKFFFVTLLSDDFRVMKKRPSLWLRRLRRKADKALRDLDISGAVAVIEPTPVLCPPDTHEPEYSFHVHAIAWADEEFDLDAARAELAASSAWRHGWGIKPTRIDEVTEDMGKICFWAGYMCKHPVDAKNVIESGDSVRLLSTTEGYRPDNALRLLEGLSQIYLQDTILGVKEGKYIRDPAWRRTKEARKLAHPGVRPVDISNRRRFWRELWKRSRADHKQPWFIAD